MSINENKKVASQFIERLSASDIPGAMDTLADDATWWLAGKRELSPATGLRSKAQVARLFHSMMEQLKDGLKMTVKGMIAEGDKVAIEIESHGELKNGRIYNNEYHMLMILRNGKIREVREYYDTHHAFATWVQR